MNLNKQTLKPLPSEIRSIVRSGININSVAQCVEELVFNSIDAGAKNIHIGINLDQFNVRVEDDGNGLNEVDLEAVGVRFTTSKCSTLVDLNNLRYYGFRGEALASIIDVSNTVDIITRPKETVGVELKKKYENGTVQGFIEKHNTQARKSGTTVVVGKLLSKLPVRQLRIDKSLQLEEVKSSLEKIALINPNLSIELRNEKNGTQLFSFKPSNCYSEAINQIFMSRIGFEVKFVQEHFLHKKFFLNLSVSNDFVKKKHYQFVFLNNRYIRRSRIHKWTGNFILDRRNDSSSPSTDKYPIFILNITCPFSEYDITLEPKKQTVEFKDWEALYGGIDGLILKLRHKNSLVTVDKKVQSVDKNISLVSSYDVKGALHSRFVAREVDVPSNKSSCTDSDRGSLGKTFLPLPDTKTRNPRNLTRTGHSTHVVNVREIRKKRKLQLLQSTPRAAKCPPEPAAAVISKPRLTIGTFERFPEWKGEFDKSAPPPPKRSKECNNNQESYKYSVPGANHNEQDDEAAGFEWKINRFLQTCQPGSAAEGSEEKTLGTIGESVQQNTNSMLHHQSAHFESINRLKNNVPACPKSPELFEHVDVEDCIFNCSAMVSKNHFEKKWTFRSTKEDIINRLMKYYKAIRDKKTKRLSTTTNSGNKKQTTDVSSVTVTVVPTENHQVLSSQQDLITSSSGFSASVKPSGECERKCPSNPTLSKPSYLKPPKFEVPSFDGFNKRSSAVTTEDQSNKYQTTSKPLFTNTANGAPDCTATTNVSSHQPPSASALFKLSKFNECSIKPGVVPRTRTASGSYNYPESFRVPDISSVNLSSCSMVEVTPNPTSKMLPLVKTSNVDFMKSDQETTLENSTNCAPPLLTLFPIQKSFSTDWSDKMISNDYNESDDNLFPSDWTAEIVLDDQNQEWLRTLDTEGKILYINLCSGESSHNIAHLFGSLKKVTAREMRQINPVRYNWLRRHFPRGFRQFWSGDCREITKEGDLTKLGSSVIGDSLLKCINQQKPDEHLSKWTDKELQNVSKYFSGSKDSSIKSVNNVSATGILGWKDLGGTTSSFRFSREDFELVRVIGQYDKKFILTLIRKSSTENENLVIFDQHAVHERIRLEQLILDSFKSQKTAMKYLIGLEIIPPYPLPLSETEVRIMQNYIDLFKQAALNFDVVSSTVVKIKSAPKCFIEKASNEPSATREGTFRNLVHSLIQELIQTIMETKVANLTALPKTVHSVLCSQACHGAIKFGDELSLDECKELILNLRSCKNLFQCAHGRPSVVPLIKGQDLLKVSTAGYNCFHQDLQPSTVVEHSNLPSHEECSKYFCDSIHDKTSGYFSNFSLLDVSNTAYKKDTSDNNRNSFPVAKVLEEKPSTSAAAAVGDFFSLLASENAINDDEEDSPYFLNLS